MYQDNFIISKRKKKFLLFDKLPRIISIKIYYSVRLNVVWKLCITSAYFSLIIHFIHMLKYTLTGTSFACVPQSHQGLHNLRVQCDGAGLYAGSCGRIHGNSQPISARPRSYLWVRLFIRSPIRHSQNDGTPAGNINERL